MSFKNYLTTIEVAKETGKSQRQIQSLCKQGSIPSHKFGRDWFIDKKFIDLFKKSWKYSR